MMQNIASYQRAFVQRKKGGLCRPLVLINCAIATSEQTELDDSSIVIIRSKTIEKVTKADFEIPAHSVIVDCEGLTLIPGLCDAHVHCTACTANLAGLLSLPESLVSLRAGSVLQEMLLRGFTTVRDAGGADWGLAAAVEEGTVVGPRLLFTGHALSQTGGHGDMRGRGEDCCACGAALRGIGRVCDGDAAVRAAARDELRKGAHCIKVMASGGVSSPTDRLTNTQFSLAELRAIVEEAAAAGTYVAAHAYTAEAISRAVLCGVRSIEHGNYLDDQAAQHMKDHGAFLVPTLVTYVKLKEEGVENGMAQELVDKVGDLVEAGLSCIKLADKYGIPTCYGSDLLGGLHQHQSKEFSIRAQVQASKDVFAAATINCARLFGLEHKIGRVAAGYTADLLLVKGNPLRDVGVLTEPSNIRMVLKEGLIVRPHNDAAAAANQQLVTYPATPSCIVSNDVKA